MSDITTKLRLVCGHDSRSVDGCLHCEAADEIERLRISAKRKFDALELVCDDWDGEKFHSPSEFMPKVKARYAEGCLEGFGYDCAAAEGCDHG